MTNTIRQQLREFIVRRYASQAHQPLYPMTTPNHDFLQIEPELAAFIQRERRAIHALLHAELDAASATTETPFLPLFVRMTQRAIYAHNQFLRLTSTEQAHLAQVYQAFMHNFACLLDADTAQTEFLAQLREVLQTHFFTLGAFMTQLHQTNAFISQPVICHEYTPEMQMALLGLDVAAMHQPVLDLGCGEHGHLVHYLRAQGVNAVGIDRLVAADAGLIQADWLDMTFTPHTWGTIISHMAFSNHFRFQHLYQAGTPERYARQFMNVLAALRVGGAFVYTPELTFIEALLPVQQYRVERQQVTEASTPFYATRITRLA